MKKTVVKKEEKKTRRAILPIVDVPEAKAFWNVEFKNGRFDKLSNAKFGSKQHCVVCDVVDLPNGDVEVVKPLYDFILEEDGPIDPETGLAKPGALMALVVRRHDGYYILVQSQQRDIIRNHHTNKWGFWNNPVVIEHTIPGGFAKSDDEDSLQTALEELSEETGVRLDPNKVSKVKFAGTFSSNRAFIATCTDIYYVLVEEADVEGEAEEDELEPIGDKKLVRIDLLDPAEDGVVCAAAWKIASDLGCIKSF